MRKKTVLGIMLSLLLIGILTLEFDIQPAKSKPTTIIVPDDYKEIQWAIGNASVGDTILVSAGTYREDVMVNKSLNIKSIFGPSLTKIIARNASCGIRITANYVNFSGFTVEGGPPAPPYPKWKTGMVLDHVSYCNISNNVAVNNTYGIFLYGTVNNIITRNVALNNTDGLWLYIPQQTGYTILSNNIMNSNNHSGFYLYSSLLSHNLILVNNTANYNHQRGIYFSACQGATVTGNELKWNNDSGIYLSISNFITMRNNEISDNGIGIELDASADKNIIYHNDMINNENQVYMPKSINNSWDNGYPSGGNYWSDYSGVDSYSGPYQNMTGSDGVGDITYVIDGNNQDNYPLMNRWSSLPVHNINTGLGYATIQEAIDAPETLDRHTIFVEAGTYYENVTVNKSISMIGEDKYNTIINGSGLNYTGALVTIDAANNVDISGFTVTNALHQGIEAVWSWYCKVHATIVCFTGDRGIVFVGGGNNSVYNNVVYNSSAYGGIEAIWSNNNTIHNNLAYSNRWGVATNHGSHNLIYNNTVYSNEEGIHIDWPSTGNNVYNNDISSNRLFGIHMLNQANENIIRDNEISQNNDKGIWLHSSSNNTISGNNITNNNEYGILLVHSGNNTVSANNANNNTYGILLYYSGNNTVSGNTANNNSLNGILIWGSGNNTVSHNAINSNNATGMAIGLSNHNTISDNFAIFNAGDGIWLWNASHNIISGNNASNNTVHNGISLGASYNNTVVNNVAHSNYHNGICLYNGSTNNQLISNILSWNNAHGIGVHESSNDNILINNNISKNNCGIGFTNSSYNTIYHNNFINNVLQVINDGSINTWDDGYPSGGNYWGDYEERYPNATEIDDSGIWDTPYVIDEYNQDNYPLMNPCVPLLGDLNDDRTVNIFDVIVLASSFGSEPDDPNWNPDADLNDDGMINILDAILIAGNFGKTV